MKRFIQNLIVTGECFVLMFVFCVGVVNADSGKELYEMNCSACHGNVGLAVLPGSPNFSKGERLEKTDTELLKSIRDGLKVMPPWQGVLSEADMKSTLSHIRSLSE